MLWLIGGTSESRMLAHALSDYGIPWVVTAVTPAAHRLYESLPGTISIGPLTQSTLSSFLDQHQIDRIVDASHPFATQISHLALSTQRPYLRFERPEVPLDPSTLNVASVEDVLQPCYLSHQRVLLTIGVKALPQFAPWHEQSHLWARILPEPEGIQQARLAGFPPDRILTMRPPVQADHEQALWSQLKIETVITKASGAAGGVAVKQQVAQALGIQLIVIQRPRMIYPQQTSDWREVIRFCQQPLEAEVEVQLGCSYTC